MESEDSFDKSISKVTSDEDFSMPSVTSPSSYLKTFLLEKKDAIVTIVTIVLLLSAVITGIVYSANKGKDRNFEVPESVYKSSSLPYFDASIVEGYDSCQDLKDDLESAAKYVVDVKIDRFANQKFGNQYGYSGWIPRGGFVDNGFGILETMDEEQGDTSGGQYKGGGGGEDSFGTNNQVDGVEEADLIKSDGSVVYAAYGDEIVVWNATTGTELGRIVLPKEDEDGVSMCENEDNSGVTSTSRVNGGIKCYQSYYWTRMTISSLLLHNNRLVVIATAPFTLSELEQQPILQGYHQTRVFTYNVLLSSSPNSPDADPKVQLNLVARKDLQGMYQTARSIGNKAHIVTKSTVNTWFHLDQHVSPWEKEFEDISDEDEYRAAAYENIISYISTFAERLAEEVLNSHGKDLSDTTTCKNIARVALMLHQEESNNKEVQGDEQGASILSFTTEGVLNDYVQVHSIDIEETYSNESNANNGSNSIIATSHSGVFLPTVSYTQNVYASDTKLIVSGNAYQEVSTSSGDSSEWQERTVLFAFDISDGVAVAHSVGEVPGSVLNQFSMDHFDYNNDKGDDDHEYIRVATTTWAQFSIVDGLWTQTTQSSNQVSILKLPSSTNDSGEAINSAGMEIVGEVTGMGVGERIYAARFMKEKGYIVTFRQVDPFYTLNLSDPQNPQVVGELKIPGFSNYLHPVSDDLILALGQDADDTGVIQGLQIAMFDVSDFSDPQQVHKYVEQGYSFSNAQYEHKAFRYLPENKLLILPLTIYDKETFNGFVVYDVDEDKEAFSRSFTISHKENSGTKSCLDNVLPSRSLVFDGKVTTTKHQTVLSHDLITFQKQWTLNLESNRDSSMEDCMYWSY